MIRIEQRIFNEMGIALEKLGAQSDLLGIVGIVGSFGDSLPDEMVLSSLRLWNSRFGSVNPDCETCEGGGFIPNGTFKCQDATCTADHQQYRLCPTCSAETTAAERP